MKIVYLISTLLLILSFLSGQGTYMSDMDNRNRVDSYTDTTKLPTHDSTATDSPNTNTPFTTAMAHHTNTTSNRDTTTHPTEPKKKNLALILGLSLGLGIPVALGVVGGIIFCCYKRGRSSRILTVKTTF